MRALQLNVRMTHAERARFRRVAKRLGFTVQDALRYLMRIADRPC